MLAGFESLHNKLAVHCSFRSLGSEKLCTKAAFDL